MYDESKHTQVRGSGVAVSGANGAPIATITWQIERSINTFQAVPANRKLVVTDFAYLPQLNVTSRHIINIAESTGAGTTILLQLVVNPNMHTQSHFHTGFVIAPGSRVVAFTDANGPLGKNISITLNGYVAALGARSVSSIAAKAMTSAPVKKVAARRAR